MTESVVVWPATLPLWRLSGYSHDPNLNRIEVDSKLGYSPKARIQQERPPQIIKASLELDDIQKSLFDWWWHRKAYKGAVWFRAPVRIMDQMEQRRIKITKLTTGQYQQFRWPISALIELYD